MTWFRTTALAALVVGIAACDLGLDSLPDDSNNPLTPVHPLVGTWRSTAPITFHLQTDACDARETFAEERWNVTWVITAAANNPNRVNIEMRRSRASTGPRTTQSCGENGTGYVPWNTGYFDATVSSSAISANTTTGRGEWIGVSFQGSYTKDQLMGTWDHWDCFLLCFGETTARNAFTLFRQQ